MILDLDELLDGYQNSAEMMVQAMEKVQSKDPEEALRLRTEITTKLQEQARIMETILDENKGWCGSATS